MTKREYLSNLVSPTPSLVLERWPKGNIVQGWAENPGIYSANYADASAVRKAFGGHQGTDIQGAKRTPIYAVQEGTVVGVTESREMIGGLIITIDSPILDDNGQPVYIRHCYAHLDEYLVKHGDSVKRNQMIGYMGNTGCIEGSVQQFWEAPALDNTHLHIAGYELVDRGRGREPRYATPLDGSFDIMTFLNGDLTEEMGLFARIAAFLESIYPR